MSNFFESRGEKKKKAILKFREKEDKEAKEKEEQVKLEQAFDSIPRSLIYAKFNEPKDIKDLVDSFKKIMEPYTAKNLKGERYDKTKQVVKFANEIFVTHLVFFGVSEKGATCRLIKLPKGPSIHFKIDSYCSAGDIWQFNKENNLKNSMMKIWDSPVVILNGFKNSKKLHVKLVATTFQNMFPPVDVNTFSYKKCKRVVLFNFNEKKEGVFSEDTVNIRHYKILLEEDVSDEGKTTMKVNLVETGPRLNLTVFKIEEGILTGEVLYHKFEKKEKKENEELRARASEKEKIRKESMRKQNEVVEKKEKEKEAKKKLKKEKLDQIRKKGLEEFEKEIKELQEESKSGEKRKRDENSDEKNKKLKK